MRAVVVQELGAAWVVEDAPAPALGLTDVLVRVEASGVCHSDVHLSRDSGYGGTFPRIPGHEFVGRVVATGEAVRSTVLGTRVGVAWPQRWCGCCRRCLDGYYAFCERGCDITGGTVDGGHAEFAAVDASSVVAVGEDLPASQIAPLLCAGYTAYSALRQAAVGPGDCVAVVGIGGIGHLAVQYASLMGASVVAVTSDSSKSADVRSLGAADVIAEASDDLGDELGRRGGVDVLVATTSVVLDAVLSGLRSGARVSLVGVGNEELRVSPRALVFGGVSVFGSSPGPRSLLAEVLAIHRSGKARVLVEELSLGAAGEAFSRCEAGSARYRLVLRADR